MKIVNRLLRRHVSMLQMTGFFLANLVGMVIILAAIQLYNDTLPVLTAPDTFMRNDYVVISKRVESIQSAQLGKSVFTAQEIDDITAQPFVKGIGEFSTANYNITAGIRAAGMNLTTMLFFESVPDEFIDTGDEMWHFDPESHEIPIIIPTNYLNLYNYGFAQSQGLPQIPQDVFKTISFDVNISGGGRTEHFKGRIVAFSNRLNTILVPQDFMEWSNARFAYGASDGPSRIIMEVADPSDEAIFTFLTEKGYVPEGEAASGGRTAYFLRLAVGIVAGIGVVITVLSLFILMLSIFLLLQKNSRKLEDLLLLGFTPVQASKPYLMLTAFMNLAVVAIAIPVVLVLRAAYIPALSVLGGESYTGGGVTTMILAGLIIAALVTLLNGVAIRRKVGSLWWHES